ncbi:MAG TPA: hypothetical protein VJ739_08900 [Gemmataceae bacterium]|nr:hypothetical protein [Gemmataceae bacterium]
MLRTVVLALIVATTLLPGCAAPPRPLLPPGEDPDHLVKEITDRGAHPDPDGRKLPLDRDGLVRECLLTTKKVAATGLVVVVIAAYICAAAYGARGGGACNGVNPYGGGDQTSNIFKDIWSADD